MKTIQLSVKEVNEEIFREFKAESTREGLKVGQALTLAMEQWLSHEKRRPKLSLLNLKPIKGGKGTERLSENIDKVLYEEEW
ncbi:MAG: hypothetical protein Q8R18_06365 [bacterium]|nr:hypothetical protein [bacterium]